MADFKYQDPFPLSADDTTYRLLTKDYVSIARFDGEEILKIEPEALAFLASQAMRDVSFLLRPKHNEQVAKILTDPEASNNDRGVAIAMLRNAEVSAKFELPFCQDTGTATIIGKKGQKVWTGCKDEEFLSKGVFKTYTEENLRYSQTIALDMYQEINSGSICLPRSISMPPKGMNTSSFSLPRAAAAQTKPSCSRKPRRCSILKAWKSSWWPR